MSFEAQAKRLAFAHFDGDTAYKIGDLIRSLAIAKYPEAPVAISITHANSDRPLFACCRPGVTSNDIYPMELMRNTVKRWGKSTAALQHLENDGFWGDDYSFDEGGWPVTIRGVEGYIAGAM